MKTRRSYLLLETVVGLALLAALGVALLRLQAAALRQYRAAEAQAEVAARMAELLESWSRSGERVTLPATGWFDAHLSWQRSARPMRIAAGVLPTQISVVVTRHAANEPPREVYRVDWLVPQPTKRGERP